MFPRVQGVSVCSLLKAVFVRRLSLVLGAVYGEKVRVVEPTIGYILAVHLIVVTRSLSSSEWSRGRNREGSGRR